MTIKQEVEQLSITLTTLQEQMRTLEQQVLELRNSLSASTRAPFDKSMLNSPINQPEQAQNHAEMIAQAEMIARAVSQATRGNTTDTFL